MDRKQFAFYSNRLAQENFLQELNCNSIDLTFLIIPSLLPLIPSLPSVLTLRSLDTMQSNSALALILLSSAASVLAQKYAPLGPRPVDKRPLTVSLAQSAAVRSTLPAQALATTDSYVFMPRIRQPARLISLLILAALTVTMLESTSARTASWLPIRTVLPQQPVLPALPRALQSLILRVPQRLQLP